MTTFKYTKQQDPDIANFLEQELERQETGLEMIPSENFVSLAVLETLGSIATNKYAEGYPGKRYYGGCQHIDKIEQLCIDRAKELFNAEHVNVQPLSGAPANIAVYFALMQPGDTILGMDLSHGGHLTHGHPVTVMANIFNFIRYKTDIKTGLIDLKNLREMALEHKPKIILAGFSAYSRTIDYKGIQEIADEVNAITMMDMAHIAGLIAGKQLENPVPIFDVVTTTTHKTLRGPRGGMILCKQKYAKQIDKAIFPGLQGGPHENVIAAKAVAFKEALQPEFQEYAKQTIKNAKTLCNKLSEYGYKIMFGTTDNHLILIDVCGSECLKTNGNITGSIAEKALDLAGITLNMNMIPDDTRKPMNPSGIRLGTPAITTRGMKEAEMEIIASFINEALQNINDKEVLENIHMKVKDLCKKFPLYPELKS